MMKWTQSHEWILVEDSIGTVGITRFAKQELGQIVHIELPKLGHRVKAGDEVVVLESTKAAADIYTPVSGKIVAVNSELLDNLNLINEDPERGGWLFKIALSHPEELKALSDASV